MDPSVAVFSGFNFMNYCILVSSALALVVLLLGGLLWRMPDLPAVWGSRIARHRAGGALLGLVCLVWSAHYGIIMLEGDLSRFHYLVKLAVPVAALLCYFYLDYLLARALGGFMILAANYLLHAAFAAAVPGRSWYSLVCLCLGVAGLFLVGTPWRLRQLLEAARQKPRLGRGTALILLLCALSLLIQPLL